MTDTFGMLIDTTRCTGCEKCVVACKEENGLPEKDRPLKGTPSVGGLSATRYSTILRRPGNHFVRQQCRHCLKPPCVSACLVGALQQTKEGAIIYDGDLCMGCRYCMLACPYGLPRYDWDSAAPRIRKCTLCHHRIIEGKEPACVEKCPEKALMFGKRVDLLKEAQARLAAEPDTYQGRIYGKDEIGGTSMLYISDIPLDFLAYDPQVGNQPLPELSWAALKKVPPVILAMGGLMGSVYWIIGRRMKLAQRRESEEKR
jgi:formate dehydrogenase iron-sulfur subunit